jgi:hypothetical protein
MNDDAAKMVDAGAREELDELRAQNLLMASSINQVHERLSVIHKMIYDHVQGSKPRAQQTTLATGGVLAVLANQLMPQLTGQLHAAEGTPTGLLATLVILVLAIVIAKRQAAASPGGMDPLLYQPLSLRPPPRELTPMPEPAPLAINRDTQH